jgi:hypothetical protein
LSTLTASCIEFFAISKLQINVKEAHMKQHAVALVKWDVFRPRKGWGGVAVYDYGSNQKNLISRVGESGTLWLIASRKIGKNPTSYHLGYKLVNCHQVAKEESDFSGRWNYVVRAKDRKQSRHFGFNIATSILKKLKFETGVAMSEVSNLGLRLLSIPQLTAESVDLLERYQSQLENGRSVFISYSHSDSAVAERLEVELMERDISSNRDITYLEPGEKFERALEQKAKECDCFIVLISQSSGRSQWVKKEVGWALNEIENDGFVKKIIPVLVSPEGWQLFPELHHLHVDKKLLLQDSPTNFDRLVAAIVNSRA